MSRRFHFPGQLQIQNRAVRRWIAALLWLCAAAVLFAAGFRIILLPQLGAPGSPASISMLLMFGLLLFLGAALLVGTGRVRSVGGIALCVFLLGLMLFLRICCLDFASGDYNTFLSKWAAHFREYGGFAALGTPIGDYNVPYLYFLAAISYLGLPDLYLIKLFSILFDLLTAWGAFLLVRHLVSARQTAQAGQSLSPFFSQHAPLVAFFVVLFLPTVVLNGALWGQCDSIYTAFLLFSLYAALQKRGAESVLLFTFAFAFKLQAVFLLPLFLILLFTRHVKWYELFLFPIAYCAICLPAILMGRPFQDIFNIYINQTGAYPYLSLNAPSLATFLPFDSDVSFWSRIFIGAAFVYVLTLVVIGIVKRAMWDSGSLCVFALLFAIGIPLLLPHMHERYFYLAEVLGVVWAACRKRRFFLPVLIQAASLGGYHAYLVLQTIRPIKYGAILFCLTLPVLLYDLLQSGSQKPGIAAAHEAD